MYDARVSDVDSNRGPRREHREGQRVPAFIEQWSRGRFFASVVLLGALAGLATWAWWPAGVLLALVAVYAVIGIFDVSQTQHTILRNFPVIGHLRYIAEALRPELHQYFVESDQGGRPFNRERRSIVYQRAKDALDTQPFGTRREVYGVGYEWISHSLAPAEVPDVARRVTIGAGRCAKPYDASLLNISAMSYGALSSHAVLALNEGAKRGGFYHNTGEGGLTPYHLERGGDVVWQIGTGYFGARTTDGGFDPEQFADKAAHDAVRMVELKLSQGAKPAHGGILPAAKVTAEIAAFRGVPQGEDCVSPPAHRAFDSPVGLLEMLARLRELSGGKPVGFKLCVGHPVELLAIVKAMLETGIRPDFITVDGAEGGTGAAPLEFSNSVGMPLSEGLSWVHNALRGAGLRDEIHIISAGHIATGFDVLRQLALGADLCNSARAMMFALGCIMALKCNTNECPTGVATQQPKLVRGLDIEDKARRVASFHADTVDSVIELVGACGLNHPADLRPHHIHRRVSATEVTHLGNIYPPLRDGCLLEGDAPELFACHWREASADRFAPIVEDTRGGAHAQPS